MAEESPWVRWTEPHEHSFAVDVPKDWKVEGGLFRRSPMQPHFMLRLSSPRGVTKMLLGNTEGFSYSVLTPLGYQLGFREEMLYSPGGDNLWLRNYRTGRVFAEVYGSHALAEECRNVKLLGSRDRRDLSGQSINQYGVPQSVTAGEAFFACEKDGKKFDAYMYTQTEMTGTPQTSAVWNADNSWGFLTPEGQGMAAGIILSRIVASVRIDQNWLARQLQVSWQMAQHNMEVAIQTSAAQSRALQSTFAEMDRRGAERHANVQHGAAQAQDEIGRLISGFDEYTTSTGDRKTVQYGAASNWWSDNRGQTLGTQSNLSPGYQWTPMTRVPLGER